MKVGKYRVSLFARLTPQSKLPLVQAQHAFQMESTKAATQVRGTQQVCQCIQPMGHTSQASLAL
jgi:hypothetical protein